MTPQQRALAATRIIDECLHECAGDVSAGLEAAEIIAAVATDEQLAYFVAEDEAMRRTLDTLDAALSTMNARGAALSMLNRRTEK